MTDWSTDDRAQRTWQTLCGMFGARLIRDFGEEVPEVWKAAIKRLADIQIRRGLAALGNSGTGRTPTLPEFVKACKTITPTEAASLAPRLSQPEFDVWHRAGQSGLLTFLMRVGGVSRPLLAELIIKKNTIVNGCRDLDAEGDPQGVRLRKILSEQLEKHYRRYEGEKHLMEDAA